MFKNKIILLSIIFVICCAPTKSISTQTFMSSDQIQNTLLNGLILISVALIGAYIYRQTQFRSFLLQKRIEIYSTFLAESEKCQRNACTSILNTITNKDKFDENQIPSIIANIYWPMIISQFSVKLILQKKYRIKFKEIIRKLPTLTIHDHTLIKGEKSKINEIENCFKEIESILEISIDNTQKIIPLSIKRSTIQSLWRKDKH